MRIRNVSCCTLVLFACLTIPESRAETVVFEIKVSAGKHDRVNVPVTVQLPVAEVFNKAGATLEDQDGKAWPCQLTDAGLLTAAKTARKDANIRELHFILPRLKAGETAALRATLDTSNTHGTSPVFAWTEEKDAHHELRFGDRPVLRYMCLPFDDSTKEKRENTYKVFHHLFDPEGTRLVTKGPGGRYTHHRGLVYGFSKTTYAPGKTVDTWHCSGDTFQSHESVLSKEAGPVLGRHRVEIGWHGKGKEGFACEERELTVYQVPGGTLVDFVSVLLPLDGTIKVDGDPQHAGFHFRADNEVAAKTSAQTVYIRPDGVDKPGATRNWPAQKNHVNLPWNAMSFVLGEQRFTACYLDRPENPKEARYSERNYGRFGSYFVAEATQEKPLLVAYRVWLQRGTMTVEQVGRLSRDFTEPVEVSVVPVKR